MTNKELTQAFRIEFQEANPAKDIDTYKGWQERGYQVQRGSKAVAALEGRGTAKDYSKSTRSRRNYFDKNTYLFKNDNVNDAPGNSWKPEEPETLATEDLEMIELFI